MSLLIYLLISVLFIIITTAKLKLHPFLSLLFAAFGFGLLSGMPLAEIVKSVNDGFGGILGYIGIVIVAGTIIGVFLEKSGGAFTMAESVLKLTGKKNVPLAMAIVGYIVSIPVFCDSGFVILSPLMKALAKRAGITLASCAIALSLGLYATHAMVPPTPGPIAAAGILGADLGLVILYGVIVSAIALLVGWLFAITVASRVYIDPAPDVTEEQIKEKIKQAPNAFRSFIPILAPMLLIVINAIAKSLPENLVESINLNLHFNLVNLNVIGFIGSPVVALTIGVLLAFLLPKKLEAQMLSTTGWVGEALSNAAIIILITGAGGAFGKVLQNSGIADAIGGPLADMNIGIWLPFIIACGIKTAQGSSTVAITTTAAIIQPLASSLGFDAPSQLALVVVMIGAGSMFVSHANDSYFWVVTQFSKMDVTTGYKLQSLGSVCEGVAAGITAWIIFLMV